MPNINIDIARPLTLGKRCPWPGRRRRDITSTEQAMREMQYLQLDPLQIIWRSHDSILHSRVLDYTPVTWEVYKPEHQRKDRLLRVADTVKRPARGSIRQKIRVYVLQSES